MTGKVQKLVHQLKQHSIKRRLQIETSGLQHLIFQGRREAREQARQPFDHGHLHLQDFAHLPHRRTRPITHHVADHGRFLSTVPLVHPGDDFFSSLVRDIQVDVRRFGPLLGDEALE